MLKIRVTGLPEEMDDFIEDFKLNYRVVSVSDFYKNRNSEYVRCYIEIKVGE